MGNREEFIKMVQSIIDYIENESHEPEEKIFYSKGALDFFEEFKKSNGNNQNNIAITEKGKNILSFLKRNYRFKKDKMQAKDIAEGLFISAKSVSGSMTKLITEGYVEKNRIDGVLYYSITEKGLNFDKK